MFFLFWIVFIVFVLTSVFLTSIILMQEPKQGGLGGLGGGDSGMDFTNIRGTAGGLHRLTIVVGIVWGLLAIALAIIPRG